MTTEMTPGAVTAEDHIREARRFAASAEERGNIYDRSADLQAAQVHATLAQTLKAAELIPMMAALVESITPAQPETPAPGDDQAEAR